MKPKSTTLSERFGFQDGELSTPKHDEIMMWLDGAVEEIFKHSGPTNPEDVKWVREEAWKEAVHRYPSHYKNYGAYIGGSPERTALGIPDEGRRAPWPPPLSEEDPPPTIFEVASKVWEKPITAQNGFMIGFIDMFIEVGKRPITYKAVAPPDKFTWQYGNRSGSWDRTEHLIEVGSGSVWFSGGLTR